MPTLDEIRVAIAEKIFNLDPSVAVHQYERYTKNASDLVAMYKSGSDGDARLHGWHVRRFATREELVAVGEWSIWHSWRIRGFMSLDDADESEKLFDTEIEAIRDSFREDETLGGLVLENIAPSGEAGIQVLASQPVMFAGVLCHSAELGLTTQHLERSAL